MDPVYRDILRRHREFIIRDLNVDRVKGSLIQNEVFRTGDWDYIAAAGRGTRRDKASELMGELPRRGPDAFHYFCEALITCGYEFLAEPLIKQARKILADRTVNIREEYRKILKHRRFALLRALTKVTQSTKLGGRTASEQKITKLKYIKEARERNKSSRGESSPDDIFDESESSVLNETLDLVEKLEHMKDELQKHWSVPGYVSKLNSVLAEGADISTLYDNVKDGIGSHYLNYFSLQYLKPSEIAKFGSVLVLIPYICDISAEAAIKARKVQRTTTTSVGVAEHERSNIGDDNPQVEHLSKVDILTEEMRKLHRKVDEKFDQMGRQIQQVEGKVDDLDTKVNDIQASLQSASRRHSSRPPPVRARSIPVRQPFRGRGAITPGTATLILPEITPGRGRGQQYGS
ncbi:uncharacterized protein LOC144864835 [Branchiostoma floridae x Branchiostoma japonicum]